MSKSSKYVISYFSINDSKINFAELMGIVKNESQKFNESLMDGFKCRLLNFREIIFKEKKMPCRIYSGHFDIYKDTPGEQCKPNENTETPFMADDFIKEKDIFVVLNFEDKCILAHRISSHIRNSIVNFRKKFKQYCHQKIDYEVNNSDDFLGALSQCTRLTTISVKLSSHYIHKLEEFDKENSIKVNLLADRHIYDLTEIEWREKDSHSNKYGKDLIDFASEYSKWIRINPDKIHSTETLTSYLNQNVKYSFRTLEEAVLLSILINNPKCEIRGLTDHGKEMEINLEMLAHKEEMIKIVADKRKTDEEIAYQVIERLSISRV